MTANGISSPAVAVQVKSGTLTLVAPAVPSGLTAAVASATQVALSWGSVANATTYEILRSTDGSTWTEVATSTTASYTDTPGGTGGTFYYAIAAVDVYGVSANSASVSVTLAGAEQNGSGSWLGQTVQLASTSGAIYQPSVAWTPSGGLLVAYAAGLDGHYQVYLREAAADAAAPLPTPADKAIDPQATGTLMAPSVGADDAGNVWAFWLENHYDTETCQVRFAFRSAVNQASASVKGGVAGWSTPATVATATAPCNSVRFAMHGGQGVIVWDTSSGLYGTVLQEPLAATPTFKTTTTLFKGAVLAYDLTMNAAGNALVGLLPSEGSAASEVQVLAFTNGSWASSPATLSGSKSGRMSNLRLGLDTQGRAVAAWNVLVSGSMGIDWLHFDGQKWGTTPQSLTVPGAAYFPDLTMTPAGNAFLATVTVKAGIQALTYFNFSAASATWSSAQTLPSPGSADDFFYPHAAVDAGGDVCVTWQQRQTGGPLASYASLLRPASTTWTTAASLTGSLRSPLHLQPVAMSPTGSCLVGWLAHATGQTGYDLYGSIFQ